MHFLHALRAAEIGCTLVAVALLLLVDLAVTKRQRSEPTTRQAAAWVGFALWAVAVQFHPQSWAMWGLVISSLWLLLAGLAQQMIPARRG